MRIILLLTILMGACRPSVPPTPVPVDPVDTTQTHLPELKILSLSAPAYPEAEITLGEGEANILFPFGAGISAVTLDFTLPEGITADPPSGSKFDLRNKAKIFLARPEDGAAAQFVLTSSFKEQVAVRGLFLPSPSHTDSFMSYSNVCSSLDLMASLNFNTLFVCSWAATKACWNSDVLVRETTYTSPEQGNMYAGYTGGSGDALKDIVSEAHKRDIKVVLWFEYGFMHRVGGVDLDDPLLAKHPDWIGIANDGGYANYNKSDFYLNAYDPDVRDFFLSLMREVLTKYPEIDGVQGDDRMPAMPANSGYDAKTVAAYKAAKGEEPSLNYQNKAWQQFRLDILNGFAGQIWDLVKGIKPTAAVCFSPNAYPWCLNNLMQDWPTWVAEGHADLVSVQCYIPANYENYVTQALRYLPASKLNPAMILKNGGNILSEENIRSEIAINRAQGTCGESQFWFDGIKERADVFRELYSNKAINPL
ncbi:MAG: family 10 glycosylhydrolase [Bacteroidales bacterium]|nr:family 10 glycosylhydrolase [Bacteroidales bacterium]